MFESSILNYQLSIINYQSSLLSHFATAKLLLFFELCKYFPINSDYF